MENASKALIIAGAILLSILIISLGIMIYNQASGVVNNNSMNEVEISSFNQKFMQYEGTNVKGAQVNALLNQIVQSNVSTQDDTSKLITVNSAFLTTGNNGNWIGSIPNNLKPNQSAQVGKAMTGKTYQITTTTNNQTGLIDAVTITGN